MTISSRLKELRKNAGMTQEEVGLKLDPQVTKAAVASWEGGKVTPRLEKLKQLAAIFGTTVSDLMGEGVGDERPVVGTSAWVPLLGYTHIGEDVDEDTCERLVEVPASVADAHPNGYCVHADGSCMDNRYPDDCVLMVDPDMEPFNGCAVLAETEGYRSVVREYYRGASTLVLSPDSHSCAFDDIIVRPDDPPVALKGVVVWYQSERDVRSAPVE